MTKRPWIYVCGPYSAKVAGEQYENIEYARGCARAIWVAGGAAVCPHMNSSFFDGVTSHSEFVRAYVGLMVRCDGVYVMGAYRESRGAMAELREARKRGMEVFIGDWLEEMSLEHWVAKLIRKVNGKVK